MKNLVKYSYYIFLEIVDLFLTKKQALPALLYHSIANNDSNLSIDLCVFERQMKYLFEKGYKTISPMELLEKKRVGSECLITFDDGFKDILTNALPVLKKYGFVATVFVSARYIGGQSIFCARDSNKNFSMLNECDIQILEAEGWTIANHFFSHTNLVDLNQEDVENEFVEAKNILSKMVRNYDNLDIVAYPRCKFNETVRNAVIKSAVQLAFGGSDELIDKESDLLNLPRISIDRRMKFWEFEFKLKYGHF